MRDRRLDIVKGLAIVLMVVVHAGCWHVLARWVNNFHMPIFFICAGWLYSGKDQTIGAVIRYVGKRIARLWFPYVLWGALCVITWNLCFQVNIYSESSLLDGRWFFTPFPYSELPRKLGGVVLMREGCLGMTGTFWFLRSMFFAICGYCVLNYILRKLCFNKLVIQSVISILILVMCAWCLPCYIALCAEWFGGRPTMLAYAFIHIGVILHEYNLDLPRLAQRRQSTIGIMCFVMLCILVPIESVSLSSGKFNHLITMLIAALSGWYGLLSLSKYIPWVAYIGEHSMPIMIFHFLAFKVVSVLGVVINGDEFFMIASFPVLYKGFWWCIFYTVVGIAVPLSVNAAWWRMFNWIKKRMVYG